MAVPLIGVWVLLTGGSPPLCAAAAPHVWQRWEQALTSTRTYENPYADVTLRVTYTGPGDRTIRAYGFWDGGDAFRIRCAFPVSGTWSWETECSDASNSGLHHRRGQVEVAGYPGDNPLYRRGFLKVSDNRRHLAFADGTPFLWMGDTAWAAPHRASDEEESAMYDAQGEQGWRAVDARGLGWRTWLSGAFGYTYGAGDLPPKVPQGSGAIWKWVMDPEEYDYWNKALQWESAFQMQYLHDFLAAIEWWRLEPAHELIRNQPEDVTRRMVLAKTAAGDLAVAYLPDNEAIELDGSVIPTPLRARWFDPVGGGYLPASNRDQGQGSRRFARPRKGDWVLLLEQERKQ